MSIFSGKDHLILELIFHKLTSRTPWYDLPTLPSGPSWQTCYQRYHRWQHAGTWKSLIHTLYTDLFTRGGLDLLASIQRKEIPIYKGCSGTLEITLPDHLLGTWQASTATLLIHLFFGELKYPRQPLATSPIPT